jgi:ubiquinol-cytochrome c reductase cytochrome b subunit
MPDAETGVDRRTQSLRGRLWKWVDQRTGADKILHHSLDEPIPGGARFAYVFGSALLFIFVSQMVTGICLALYYVPAPMVAHVSVAYIVKEVAAGAFLRSLHSYGSSAMVIILLLHFLQTFLYGSYKGKRELLWISGCALSLLVLGMAFTGYLLPWDQKAYFASSVGTNIAGQVPIIGESLRLLLRGGATMGALTISRFYVLHVFIIPALIFLLVAVHIFLFRKAGAAGPADEDPVTPHLPAEMFYPRQVLIDMGFVLVVMGVLGMLAHFLPVTLGPEANPTDSRYLPRPEWYYLPMFQWLKYWEGWRTVIGIVIIPVILIGLFFSLPFLDRGPERRPWRRPIPVGGVFIVLIGLLWLGMTSHLEDSHDPAVAAQLAEQNRQESGYFHVAFQPFSASSASEGAASGPLDATAAMGKGVFDTHGCSGCHGQSGAGGVGPALTHISSQYPPAQLTALLKAPTAKMKAAGMVPLAVDSADMEALVAYVSSLGGASADSAAAPSPSGPSQPEPSKVKPGATAEPSKAAAVAAHSFSASSPPATAKPEPHGVGGPSAARTGITAVDATAAEGKGIFETHGCSGCHGEIGGGGVGPALTHISNQYPPTQLTALLKAPTAKMKAAGMVPLNINSADMEGLVSYVTSLGGASAGSAPTSPASGPSQPVPAKDGPAATTAPSKAASAAAPPASGTGSPAPGKTEPASTAGAANAPTASSADGATAQGKAIFESQRCGGCHGASGGGGVGPALTDISRQYPPDQLTALLKAPSAKMKAAGMVPQTMNSAEMEALISYVSSLGGASPDSGATPSGPGSSSPATTKGEPAEMVGLSKAESQGKEIFNVHGCAECHGTGGAAGTAAAVALAGTGKNFAPAILTTMLKHPTVRMQQGGMPPVSLGDDELKALVAYVSHISASKINSQ